ncbi:MAG TPA: MAPEG family protein [Woeseiaceae bacterium]|nr:MAPEG family protein [Woeseiaceae bacterium]
MNDEAIFLPMLMNMALTAFVWFYMYAKRIPAMKKAKLSVQTYTTPARIEEYLPAEVNYSANNLKNLFELPVLFYALCLYLFVSGNVDAVYVGTAWAFVTMRVLHSIVHSTCNIVMLRFYCYAAGAVALWFMLGRALIDAVA